jgi:hypothetical protein
VAGVSGDVGAELLAALGALPSAEVLLERERQRALQRADFIARAGRWLDERGGRLVLPLDRAELVALGVPCEDCLELVTAEGAGGHLVDVRFGAGERVGASIAARCGRRPDVPVAVVGP